MPTPTNHEQEALRRGVQRLTPTLTAHGFQYTDGDQAVSSGGPFAVGFFRRGPLELGLIIRSRDRLGCPNYSVGHGYAGHGSLVWALGADGTERLIEVEHVHMKDRDGGDGFDALLEDLETIILPTLCASEDRFRDALDCARRKDLGLLLGMPPPTRP
jgi:hypothetical protein